MNILIHQITGKKAGQYEVMALDNLINEYEDSELVQVIVIPPHARFVVEKGRLKLTLPEKGD